MISGQNYTFENISILENVHKPNAFSDSEIANGGMSPKEVAEYSTDLLTELRDLATAAGHTFLAYLIQVALEEAKIQADGHDRD